MPDSREWAAIHLESGYCPIPTLAGTKGACVPWKPWQEAKPTADDLEAWWPTGKDRNIALVCGLFHGLVVVDADNAEAVRFAKLQFSPTPYRVRTSRGMHFYYRHPGGKVQTKARVFGETGPEVDVRGDGGMATALGSVHASGHVYQLDRGADMVSVLDLPLWSNSWIPAPRPLIVPNLDRTFNGSGLERAERYLEHVPGAGKGIRNQNTFRAASSAVRDFGLTEEEGWALMSAWNTGHNDPPLPEDELKAIVRSCLTSGRSPIGVKLNETTRGQR